jgi:hypothetical protein
MKGDITRKTLGGVRGNKDFIDRSFKKGRKNYNKAVAK